MPDSGDNGVLRPAGTVDSVAVLGAGSWGTALAVHLAFRDIPTCLWVRDSRQAQRMQLSRMNENYLPGLKFPSKLEITADFDEALSNRSMALIVTPSSAFRATLLRLGQSGWDSKPVAWGCKGFEVDSARMLHEVAAEVLGRRIPTAVVTGPSFARELALQLPTAVTVASRSEAFAAGLAAALHGGSMRAYTSPDIVGAEFGGAVKNVLAVATGISDGMALGANARAALITRGLAEMMRLGVALGAQSETLMGLSGIGDLVLTCTGEQSRNRRFGLKLGRGVSIKAALQDIGQVVEGVRAAAAVVQLGRKYDIELPIAEQVAAIVAEQLTPREGLENLLSRGRKAE